jgi:DNA-binding transcriptional LysR family regulator
LANTLDVACYIDVPAPRGLTVEPVGQDELIVIASPQHALAGQRHVAAQQLDGDEIVGRG